MSNLTPRLSEVLDAISGERGYSRVSRRQARREAEEVGQAIGRERGRGEVAVERLNARARATHAGLMNTGLLSKEEELLIQFAPLGDLRYKAWVDSYAIWGAGEVSGL